MTDEKWARVKKYLKKAEKIWEENHKVQEELMISVDSPIYKNFFEMYYGLRDLIIEIAGDRYEVIKDFTINGKFSEEDYQNLRLEIEAGEP